MAYKRRVVEEKVAAPAPGGSFTDEIKKVDVQNFRRMLLHSGLMPLEQRRLMELFKRL